MTNKEKLEKIIEYVESIVPLIEGNQYQTFFVSHLVPIKYEVERQLSLEE
jgi:hypothetical protein